MSLLKQLVSRNTNAKWKERNKRIKFYLKRLNELDRDKPYVDVEKDTTEQMEKFKAWFISRNVLLKKLDQYGYKIKEDNPGLLQLSSEQNESFE